jgi:L-fuculose-phosphate aldolase
MPTLEGPAALTQVGRDLWTAGLVTSHGGNLSLREGSGALISGTGTMLGRLARPDLVTVDAAGEVVEGALAPSSNTDIHLAIYRAHAEARAIVHAHGIYTTILAGDRDQIVPTNFEGRLLFENPIPVLDEAATENPDALAAAFGASSTVVVRNHGSFVRADDPWLALRDTTALEEAATIMVFEALLGRG